MKNNFSKGFTLVELLIVITILAALAAAVVLVLNPAELLAQARDAQRLSDMTTMRDSINLFISQVTAPNLCVTASGCSAGGHCTNGTAGPFSTTTCTTVAVRTIAGAGWVTVNFTLMPGGSPIATLPMDPVNVTPYFYAFKSDNTARTFELATRLESVRHRVMMTTDGGNQNTCPTTFVEQGAFGSSCYFEVGTNVLTL